MESEILSRKKTITENDIEKIDFTTASMKYSSDEPSIIDSFFIAEDMVMRIDLASYVAYGNTDYYDILLKFNGISNPFSLDRDMFILVPEARYMTDSMVNPQEIDLSNEIRKQYIDTTKNTSTNTARTKFDEAMKALQAKSSNSNFSDYPLPPNISSPGSKEGRQVSDDTVILGGDV